MSEKPRYWGSWKGRVVKAITIERAQTWGQIREHTGLSRETLNKVLSELYDAKAIEKDDDGRYWVNYKLYKSYKQFFDDYGTLKEDIVII